MKIPEYPLIDLGDGSPASKSTIEAYESAGELGMCNNLAIMNGAFSPSRRFYDRDGNVYRISDVTPAPELSKMMRILAHACYNPHKTFDVSLEVIGEADLRHMVKRIRELLDNDPGDLLYQWTDDKEWNRGLDASTTVSELFDFITQRALIDHYDYPENLG